MISLKKVVMFLGCLVLSIILTRQPLYLLAQEKGQPISNDYSSLSSDLEKIRNIASKVTVKIYKNTPNQPPGGSGFIIKKLSHKGSEGKFQYFVLTNKHVIDSLKDDLRIITADSQSHPVQLQQLKFSKDIDLGLLYFYSENIYSEAKLNVSYKFQEREKLAIFGFPCEDETCKGSKFVVGRVGPVDLLLPNGSSLSDGYSLPYDFLSSGPEVGMSGSPVFNLQGEVVAIHGKGKHIQNKINNDSAPPYLLDNEKKPDIQVQRYMYFFFWAIPLTKIRDSNIDKNIIANTQRMNSDVSSSSGSSSFKYANLVIIACFCLISGIFFWKIRRKLFHKVKEIYFHVTYPWSKRKILVSKDQQLLDMVKGLNLAGTIVVVDANGCQEEMAKTIIEKRADYVIFLKDNSEDVYKQVEKIFKDAAIKSYVGFKYSVYNSTPFDGRLDDDIMEYCITQIMTHRINSTSQWVRLNSIGMMQRSLKDDEEYDESCRYFISSLENDIQLLTESIRESWNNRKKTNEILLLKRTLMVVDNL